MAWESCRREEFPPPEEGATTRSLKRSKRRVAHPLAIAWPHLLFCPSQRFCYTCVTKVQTPMVNTCVHVHVQTRTVLVYMYTYVQYMFCLLEVLESQPFTARSIEGQTRFLVRRARHKVYRVLYGRHPEKCPVDLGRDTRTSTQSRRIVRRKDASWSLNWPSGANLLVRKQHMYFFLCLCDYCVLVFLCYWESNN